VAYADLGGLGSKQGAPVTYDWVMPSLTPQVLPWLAILALLMLKPNRCATAWWILVPLACAAWASSPPESLRELLPASQLEIFLELIGALGFGLAAVWLLAGYLGWKHRMLAFLGILLALGGFGLLTCVARQGLGIETLQVGFVVTASALVISVALTLAGLMCRGRYGGLRLCVWLFAALVVVWLLVIGPFAVIAAISSGGNVPLGQFLGVVPMMAGLSFGIVLPFLVLAFANDFYRERLQGLLHLGAAAPPPIITSRMQAVLEAAGS